MTSLRDKLTAIFLPFDLNVRVEVGSPVEDTLPVKIISDIWAGYPMWERVSAAEALANPNNPGTPYLRFIPLTPQEERELK